MQKLENVQNIVKQLNIIDDTLFQKMAEDPGFCEELISTILQQKVVVKQFKESERGEQKVCELVENYAKQYAEIVAKEAANEAAKEAAKEVAKEAAKEAEKVARETARKLFANGVSYEVVRASISAISDEKLEEIYQESKR